MEENLQHTGVIIGIEDRLINIRMDVRGGCASCNVKGICGVGESEEKDVMVLSDVAEHYSVGEEVVVSVTRMMGVRAVIYAYVFPFLLMLGTLLVLLGFGVGESVAGLSSLGAVAMYYVVLFLARGKVGKEIVFKISKI